MNNSHLDELSSFRSCAIGKSFQKQIYADIIKKKDKIYYY